MAKLRIKIETPLPTCPKCGWKNTRLAVSGGWLDNLARIFMIAPFRCRQCRHRFYRFTAATARPAAFKE